MPPHTHTLTHFDPAPARRCRLAFDEQLVVTAVVLANVLFVVAALCLYELSVLVTGSPATAVRACVLFCVNPANVFMVTAYSESLYSATCFGGLWLLAWVIQHMGDHHWQQQHSQRKPASACVADGGSGAANGAHAPSSCGPAQDRWDRLHNHAGAKVGDPDDFVVEHELLILRNNTTAVCSAVPDTCVRTAADFGGGTGGTALWLAERGLRSTLVEVSAVAIAAAKAEAFARGVALATVHHDLESGVPVSGRWDVAVCSNFLDRTMLAGLHDRVTAGGVVLVRIATVTNLERSPKPSRRFLVDRGELPGLLPGFATVSFTEGWYNGRHEARFVGRRAGVSAQPSGVSVAIWFGVALVLLAVRSISHACRCRCCCCYAARTAGSAC